MNLKTYQTALALKNADFQQWGKGYYLYKDGEDIIKKNPLTKDSKEIDHKALVYVPTKQELVKNCNEIFRLDVFKYFSEDYFSPIVVNLDISESKIKLNKKTIKPYTSHHLKKDEIYSGLAALYLNLKSLGGKKYSKKEVRFYAILGFVIGLIIAFSF